MVSRRKGKFERNTGLSVCNDTRLYQPTFGRVRRKPCHMWSLLSNGPTSVSDRVSMSTCRRTGVQGEDDYIDSRDWVLRDPLGDIVVMATNYLYGSITGEFGHHRPISNRFLVGGVK